MSEDKIKNSNLVEWIDGETPVSAVHLNAIKNKVISNSDDINTLSNAMLNLQPKSDNSLQTTNKSVVGAINELKGNKFDKVTITGSTLKFFADNVEKYSIDLPENQEVDLSEVTNALATKYDNVEIVGQELKFYVGSVLKKTINIPVGEGGEVDLSGYQLKIDETLTTKDKRIVAAINEVNSHTSQNALDIEQLKQGGSLSLRDPLPNEIFTIEGSTPPPTIYGNIVLSKSTTTIVEGGTDTFTVKLDKAPTNNQIVSLSKNNNDVTLSHASLTFTPQNYNSPQTVNITVAEDDSDYSNENCTITLSSPNVSSKTLAVTITDNDEAPSYIPVESITLNHSTSTIQVDGTLQLTPIFDPPNATNQNVTWQSDNDNFATVSTSGLVTGIAEGSCTITCTTEDENKIAICNVSISNIEVPSVQDSVIFNEGYLQAPIELLELTEVTAYSKETYKVFSFNKIKLGEINSLIEKVDITNLVKENSLEGFELVNWGSFTEDSKLQYAIRSNNYIAIKIPTTSLGSMTVEEFLKSIGVENLSFKTKSDMVITRIDSSKFTTFSTREATNLPNAQYVKIGYQNDNITNALGLSNKGFKVGEAYVWTAKYECLKIKDNFLEILFKPNTLTDLSLDGVKRYLISNDIIIYS